MLGNENEALELYTKALHIYKDITDVVTKEVNDQKVSEKSKLSYASTLNNIGVLYRQMADKPGVKGMERLQLLERAQEALEDCISTRQDLLERSHRDTLSSLMQLSTVLTLKKDPKGKQLLIETLSLAVDRYGDM